MEAKDIVMSDDELAKALGYESYEELSDIDRALSKSVAEAQAEITWPIAKQEGRREVVEWIEEDAMYFQGNISGAGDLYIKREQWQVKLKEWGIE